MTERCAACLPALSPLIGGALWLANVVAVFRFHVPSIGVLIRGVPIDWTYIALLTPGPSMLLAGLVFGAAARLAGGSDLLRQAVASVKFHALLAASVVAIFALWHSWLVQHAPQEYDPQQWGVEVLAFYGGSALALVELLWVFYALVTLGVNRSSRRPG